MQDETKELKKKPKDPPKIVFVIILPLFGATCRVHLALWGAPWLTLDSKSALLGRPWGHLGPQDPSKPPKDLPKSAQDPSKSLLWEFLEMILGSFSEDFKLPTPQHRLFPVRV